MIRSVKKTVYGESKIVGLNEQYRNKREVISLDILFLPEAI